MMPAKYPEIGAYLCRQVERFLTESPTTNGWNALRVRLVGWFRQLDEHDAFFGMLWVLQNSHRYQDHELAGELLLGRRIRLQLSLSEVLSMVARNINASARSVFQYFGEMAGSAAVIAEMEQLAKKFQGPSEKTALQTFRYYLDPTN